LSVNSVAAVEVPLFRNPLTEEDFTNLVSFINVEEVNLNNLIDYFLRAKFFVTECLTRY